MRVLVTGGAGYLGSHLVDLLLEHGHEVTVLDNLSTGKADNLAHCLDQVRFVNGTILDEALVDRLVEKVDLVYHLAAAVGVKHIVDRPLDSLLTNARGTEVVLGAAHRWWRKVVVASTSEVYGKTAKIPMAEDDDRVLGSTKVHRWGYSTAKALDEHLVFAYSDLGLPVTAVRYFNSYGPRIDPRGYGSVVAAFMGQALSGQPLTIYGDGTQTRCFTFVDDTVRGTYQAGMSSATDGTAVNLGNPNEITILELADRVRTLVGVDTPLRFISYEERFGKDFEDTGRRVPDITRVQDLLGWEPTVELDEGLGRTLEWWKQTFS
ncbi:MAG: NAD-dependent epimerase/dehydratase family protein [Acidimicrobiia bacterium]|nr:NAD-dependent epimerase/dehydratase family protein [Acidimicrobiia bacterium]